MTSQAKYLKQILKAVGCTKWGSTNISVRTEKNGEEWGQAKCHIDSLTNEQYELLLGIDWLELSDHPSEFAIVRM